MADAAGELDWISDYVLTFMKSPTWVAPIAQFVDERCIIFSADEENKLEYTICHNEFKDLIDSLLAAHLMELSVTAEQFAHFCRHGLAGDAMLHRVLVEQLLSVDDFLTFKAMMVKRNMNFLREAAKRFELEDDADAGDDESFMPDKYLPQQTADFVQFDSRDLDHLDFSAEEWELYEQQLYNNLETECMDYDEDLQRVIALSLLEEASLKHAEQIASTVEVSTAVAAPISRPVVPRVLRVEPLSSEARAAGAAVSSLPEGENPLDAAKRRYDAILQREKAAKAAKVWSPAVVPAAPAAPAAPAVAPAPAAGGPPTGPTEEERRKRAEHLQRQRELLLQKRSQARERQLGEFQSARQAPAPGPTDAGRRLAAELSAVTASSLAAPLDPQAAAVEMRKAIAAQLRQTLARNM